MTTDQELLELAAKAAGFTIEAVGIAIYVSGGRYMNYLWNPLEDDGDALRLAVKLRILVQTDICFAEVPHEKQCKATRQAIVKAAAAIGKAL